MRAQNSSGSSAASGFSTTMRSTVPRARRSESADVLGASHVGGVGEVAVHDGRGTLGWQRRQPGVLGGDDPVRGQ